MRFTKPDYSIDCYLEYGACNDAACLPPTSVELKKSGKSPVAVSEQNEKANDKEADNDKSSADEKKDEKADEGNADETMVDGNADALLAVEPSDSVTTNDLWASSVEELRALGGGTDNIANHNLLYILLMGFVGGLLAVLMPCIWPIIPMTVSFFLKRAKTDKKRGIRDAITYGLSIIVIYLVLGLLVTALFGSDTLNAMSTNAVFNIFLFVL